MISWLISLRIRPLAVPISSILNIFLMFTIDGPYVTFSSNVKQKLACFVNYTLVLCDDV